MLGVRRSQICYRSLHDKEKYSRYGVHVRGLRMGWRYVGRHA